jgi:hypothetical protein
MVVLRYKMLSKQAHCFSHRRDRNLTLVVLAAAVPDVELDQKVLPDRDERQEPQPCKKTVLFRVFPVFVPSLSW